MAVLSQNPLGELISRFRANGRWSREDVASFARKKGHQISASYIQKIETGSGVDPDTISAGKYAALAAVLGVTEEQVRRIARGVAPATGLMSTPTSDQGAIRDGDKTPKPWPLHDLSRTSTANEATERGTESGNDLSKSNRPGEPSGNIGISKGDRSHILSLADMGPWRNLPVYRVSCGERVFINDEPLEIVSLPSVITGPADGILKVEGDSMLGCGYRPGDLLFFERINGRRPKDGEKVIAEVNGGAVCKVYRRDDSGEFLVSAPGDQDDMHFFHRITDEVRLIGIVKKRLTDG